MNKTLIDPADMARRVVDVLSDRQAEDVVLLDIHEIAPFTDYFVIATAQNQRHMSALLDAFGKELANEGLKSLRTEGESDRDALPDGKRLRLQSPRWWAIQDSNLKPTD